MASGIEWTEPLDSGPVSVIEMERSPDWVKFILDRPMSSAPGDTFNYNSGNPHLLSAVIAKLTGMSALEYGKAKLFGPLGINDVYWRRDPQGVSTGGIRIVLTSSRHGEDRLFHRHFCPGTSWYSFIPTVQRKGRKTNRCRY
jgi:CubicO group peptidase (beta-lactamase class C family)